MAKAAIEAVERGVWSKSTAMEVKKADLHCPMDNEGYLFLAKRGVFDTIPVPEDGSTPQFKTWIYAITLGDAQIVTTPGEFRACARVGLRDRGVVDGQSPGRRGVQGRGEAFGFCE